MSSVSCLVASLANIPDRTRYYSTLYYAITVSDCKARKADPRAAALGLAHRLSPQVHNGHAIARHIFRRAARPGAVMPILYSVLTVLII